MADNADGVERQILQNLGTLATGFSPMGTRLLPQEQIDASKQYMTIKEQLAARALARDRLDAEKETSMRRLAIEEEKVKVQKAEIIVRALEAVGQHGIEPERLLEAVKDLSLTLLGDGTRQLTQVDKS